MQPHELKAFRKRVTKSRLAHRLTRRAERAGVNRVEWSSRWTAVQDRFLQAVEIGRRRLKLRHKVAA